MSSQAIVHENWMLNIFYSFHGNNITLAFFNYSFTVKLINGLIILRSGVMLVDLNEFHFLLQWFTFFSFFFLKFRFGSFFSFLFLLEHRVWFFSRIFWISFQAYVSCLFTYSFVDIGNIANFSSVSFIDRCVCNVCKTLAKLS